MDSEIVMELRKFIAIAEACHRGNSHSWHVLDWMSYQMHLKIPLVRECDLILSVNHDIT